MQITVQKIKQLALDAGFEKVGVSSADQPDKSTHLDNWLKQNYHGTMTWMATHKEKRMDIKQLYPDARSVVSVAHNYYAPEKREQSSMVAKISRYAWGQDYHKIIKKKLKNLLKEIKALDQDIDGRICVDTAPIMEKLWAQTSGIGWQGKHTNLITKEYGSWVFLGEIILNKEFDYDLPATDMCGSCSRCIEACPTRAIIAPYQLDATRCIAYLTIEYWDQPIPKEFSGKFEQFVFGCDICQEVCPWNRFKQDTAHAEYHPAKENTNPQFDDLLKLTEPEFRQRFKKSPVMRTGWKNFIRNLLFAAES